MPVSCSMRRILGFAAALLFLDVVYGQEFRQAGFLETFSVDVTAPSYSMTAKGASPLACSRTCASRDSCLSFAFAEESHTCWLYYHLVLYTTNGTAAPGTRYFWRLSPRCPTQLGYTLKDNVCFRVSMTWVNRSVAEEECRQDGAHLFIADTAKKISLLLAASTSLHLGASDVDEEGDWRWVDGRPLPLDFPLWYKEAPGNPDNSRNWLRMKTGGRLRDMSETMVRRVACQIPFFN